MHVNLSLLYIWAKWASQIAVGRPDSQLMQIRVAQFKAVLVKQNEDLPLSCWWMMTPGESRHNHTLDNTWGKETQSYPIERLPSVLQQQLFLRCTHSVSEHCRADFFFLTFNSSWIYRHHLASTECKNPGIPLWGNLHQWGFTCEQGQQRGALMWQQRLWKKEKDTAFNKLSLPEFAKRVWELVRSGQCLTSTLHRCKGLCKGQTMIIQQDYEC